MNTRFGYRCFNNSLYMHLKSKIFAHVYITVFYLNRFSNDNIHVKPKHQLHVKTKFVSNATKHYSYIFNEHILKYSAELKLNSTYFHPLFMNNLKNDLNR